MTGQGLTFPDRFAECTGKGFTKDQNGLGTAWQAVRAVW